MRVCLFEDRSALDLEPLALTRPVFDLLCGCTTLAEKHFRAFHAIEHGALVRAELADLTRQTHPGLRVNDPSWLAKGPVILVNARWLPAAPPALVEVPDRPGIGLIDDEIAYVALSAELAATRDITDPTCLDRFRATLPACDAPGRLVRHLWELVDLNGAEIILDLWLAGLDWPRCDAGRASVIGPADRLHVDPSARIDPFVAADTTAGPVVIAAGAVVTSFTRLEGPCYVGPGARVMGAKVRAGTSLGPQCRVGGEVECSVMLAHSNKYHDGFLGHAYVGEWVNLGAGTSNSDLRNDYGDVTVMVRGRRIDTRRSKVGCFLGDHTKAALGCLINTGTSAGAFSQLLPTGSLLPKVVPSFTSVWNGSLAENTDIEALLATAEKVMRRRNYSLTNAHRALYRGLFEQTAAQRRAAIRESEARRLRRSA